MTPFQLKEKIKEKALELGFDACGIARVSKLKPQQDYLTAWLENNYHGRMAYMANHFDKRLDPGILVPGARSVIVVAQNYYPAASQPEGTHYKIARYAFGKDYHFIIRERLEKLASMITESFGAHQYRAFTDSAPVMERAWAIEAGLGQTGKNACLILPRRGSYYFLGELMTSLEIQPDPAFEKDLCGNCTKCMDACPTGAIVSPGRLDARKCISYLTIELKGPIPAPYHARLKGNIFGCDICQEACPHNKHAVPHGDEALKPLDAITKWGNEQWENLNRDAFSQSLKKQGSPLARVSHSKLIENIGIVRENLNEADEGCQ